EMGPIDLPESTLDGGTRGGFGSILAGCPPVDGHHLVNKRAPSSLGYLHSATGPPQDGQTLTLQTRTCLDTHL
ncbi:hypothetical protein M9458_029864, partial [Cirrhinus mrigala]